jgi:hypothetical protein
MPTRTSVIRRSMKPRVAPRGGGQPHPETADEDDHPGDEKEAPNASQCNEEPEDEQRHGVADEVVVARMDERSGEDVLDLPDGSWIDAKT